MSKLLTPEERPKLRADAERSIAAILDAAVRILSERPDASIEEIARAAGVTRQTVYTHFGSREALFEAVVARVTVEVLTALDATGIDDGPPVDALNRFLTTAWETIDRYPLLLQPQLTDVSAEEAHEQHAPVIERVERLIRRGQESGDFDRSLSPAWLLAATIGLGHAAGEEVAAGRMSAEAAGESYRRSVLRIFGVGEAP